MTADRAGSSPRRVFFREAVVRAVRPLADYIEQRMDLPAGRVVLRPPGAIEESQFIDTCYRCGGCREECPADAIFPLDKAEGDAAGTPAIDPDRAACVVCDGLKCTKGCPSGALQPVRDPREIRMGVAEVYEPNCVRTRGEACTLCADRCPLGETAIGFGNDGPPTVLTPGCVGCGVCQLYCPTGPKAIVVRPI
ncbi:MAG: hypothetical protein JSU86_19620 [Phycisphaerales bacterium]|nr:MAG: hypothetical protein JSU86_19620 [Phycisphaerales bacterium]